MTAGAAALRVTHLAKPLWPAPGGPVTKGEYLAYLGAIAPHALPHLLGRPLVLTRYPHGAGGPSFYQKNLPRGAPAWLPRFRHTGSGGRALDYLVPAAAADLIWVGQQAALEFHPWLSTVAHPAFPDRAVIDLDPMAPAGFEEARQVARVLGELLRRSGVRSWLKTSGATGLHVLLPIAAQRPHRAVAADVRAVAELLRRLWPERVTLERAVARRGARVYVDYPQNGPGKTVCAAYSPRPLPGAPVSTPLDWAELDGVQPGQWTVRTVPPRLAARPDPWRDLPDAPPEDLGALARACRGARGAPAP